ncbi:MAG: peptidoglycan N-acetylmuramoylhydrolase [Arcobacter sp.]|nr:MAG: peptidoglycan N-acetylmuramoylhydrolase [Arcobacter sp.]
MSFSKLLSLLFISLLLFHGCSSKIKQKPEISKANLSKIDMGDIKGFSKDNLEKALEVFQKDCKKSIRDPRLTKVCKKALEITNKENAKDFFIKNFTAFQLLSDTNDKEGLITGYFEPLLQGSYIRTDRFQYPLYEVPKDLLTIELSQAYPSLSNYRLRGKLKGNKVVPYDTREEINAVDYRTSKNLQPICFVDDKIELFFLQIQGSGKVQLPNGKFINIAYGQQNGHPYYPIGRELIAMGEIEKENISLQSIKKWLKQNPDRIDEILNFNKSYVFFTKSEKSATGSLGTQLVASRNLAVDRKNIPLGFPVFIKTTNPITNEPIHKLMVAADTGGAIKGKIRADIFFGTGQTARELAGKMKQQGELFIFIPNTNIKKKD